MKKHLISFGNWHYYKSLDVLTNTAIQYGKIDSIKIFKESDIPTIFYEQHHNHFKDNRGFGYWVWKSFIINQCLLNAADDDIFMYVDAGNTVINDMAPLFEYCNNDLKGIVMFDNSDGEPNNNLWKNNMWTKADCFNLIGLNDNKYINGNQINASYIMFKKTTFSVKFFNCFAEICSNYNIISDAPNITNNFNANIFKDHRHDQSILSLLSIKYNLQIKRDPSQWGNNRVVSNSEYPQIFNHHRRLYYL